MAKTGTGLSAPSNDNNLMGIGAGQKHPKAPVPLLDHSSPRTFNKFQRNVDGFVNTNLPNNRTAANQPVNYSNHNYDARHFGKQADGNNNNNNHHYDNNGYPTNHNNNHHHYQKKINNNNHHQHPQSSMNANLNKNKNNNNMEVEEHKKSSSSPSSSNVRKRKNTRNAQKYGNPSIRTDDEIKDRLKTFIQRHRMSKYLEQADEKRLSDFARDDDYYYG